MEKLTYEQIIEKLKSKGITSKNFAYEDYDHDGLELGEINEVKQKGGEDQGSEWYSVKHFVDHNIYIRIDGYYSSYDGTDFDNNLENCCKQVTPQKKKITVYE